VVPRLSLQERDRRWARVRALMRRDGLDAIITLANSSAWDHGNAYGRYLTCIGGNCAQISAVFPVEGPVTAITGPIPTPAFWLQFQDWVTDVRSGFFHATPAIMERLRDLGFERGRIGIAGLKGVARVPDGLISHIAYTSLVEQLPQATFCNATLLLDEARFVKGEEEIDMLRQAAVLVEGALDVLEREARPGIAECVVYGRMMGNLIEQGSEPTTLLLWAAGNPVPPAVATLPSRRQLASGDVIMIELDANWCGYRGHGALTAWVGETADATARSMAKLQFEAVQRCLEAMRPGTPMAALVEVCSGVAAGTGFRCKPIIHGRGLGNDPPILVFHARDERNARWLLEENSCFIVKPVVMTEDGTRRVMWGDTVVVTANGARRLGTRPAPLVGV
jgi:Xaa-Pro dipeptidase